MSNNPHRDDIVQEAVRRIRMRSQNTSADEIVNFMEIYYLNNGLPPTVREIQAHMGFKSPKAVSYWLEILAKDGRIKRRYSAFTITTSRTYLPVGFEVRRIEKNNLPYPNVLQ